MNTVNYFYLHVETLVLFIYLGTMLWFEWQRQKMPAARRPVVWAKWIVILLTMGILWGVLHHLLHGEFPWLSAGLTLGMTLALMNPVQALCFWVHLLILRPWEAGVD